MSASCLLCNHNTSALSLGGGVTGQWQKMLCSAVLYAWTCRCDLGVIYCSCMLGHGMPQGRWLRPRFWKCSHGLQLALGKAASRRSQYWFFRMPPCFAAEGWSCQSFEATRKTSLESGLQKALLQWLRHWLSVRRGRGWFCRLKT